MGKGVPRPHVGQVVLEKRPLNGLVVVVVVLVVGCLTLSMAAQTNGDTSSKLTSLPSSSFCFTSRVLRRLADLRNMPSVDGPVAYR